MGAWLVHHEFLASWLSAIAGVLATVLTLVSMVRSSQRAETPFKWNAVVMRIGFLLCLSGILSPTLPSGSRGTLGVLAAMLMGAIMVQANRE